MRLNVFGLVGLLAMVAVLSSGGVSAAGPLAHKSSIGTVGLYPPSKPGPWQAMFGGGRLCVTSPATITVTKVEPTTTSDGQPVRAVVRRFSKEAVAAGAQPMGSAKGVPETEFAGKAGQSVEPAIGARTSRSCSEDPWVEGRDEILVVSSTTGEGNYVKDIRVTYEVNGREYQVEFGGTFSLCNRKKVCPGLDL